MNLIGNNIRRLREERNMLQSELAAKVNVSPATVSSWEVGRTEPKIGKVEEICAVFHCEKSDIVESHSQNDAQARRLLAYYNMLSERDKLQLIIKTRGLYHKKIKNSPLNCWRSLRAFSHRIC